MLKSILSCVLALSATVALAGDLKSPVALENAETLPKNVRNPRFVNVFTTMDQRFGAGGDLEPLGSKLNKSSTWANALKEQDDDLMRLQLRGALKALGIEEGSGGPGESTGTVNTYANVKVAALAWGITEKFTVAGVLPIVHIEANSSLGFLSNEQSDRLYGYLAKNASPQKARESVDNANNAVNRKLSRLGYKPIPTSQTINGIGDAQLVAKYRLYNDNLHGVAIKSSVIFPTGIAPDADKALDIPTGDGRFGLGVQAIYDFRVPMPAWSPVGVRWNNYLSYTAMLPRTIERRIPTSVDDALSAEKEDMYEYTRSIGAIGTGLEFPIHPVGIILSAGELVQVQSRASYRDGTTYGEDRYYLLDDQQPSQFLHSSVFSAAFSTIEWFRQKKFVYPMQISVSYSHPWHGRNVPSNDLVTGELVVFF